MDESCVSTLNSPPSNISDKCKCLFKKSLTILISSSGSDIMYILLHMVFRETFHLAMFFYIGPSHENFLEYFLLHRPLVLQDVHEETYGFHQLIFEKVLNLFLLLFCHHGLNMKLWHILQQKP